MSGAQSGDDDRAWRGCQTRGLLDDEAAGDDGIAHEHRGKCDLDEV